MTKQQQADVDIGYRLAKSGKRKPPQINIWMMAGWHDYHIMHNTGVYE